MKNSAYDFEILYSLGTLRRFPSLLLPLQKTDCRSRYRSERYRREDNHFKQDHASHLASDKRANQT